MKVNGEELFNELEELEFKEIMTRISAEIEYVCLTYDIDFDKLLEDIKNCHEVVFKQAKDK